MEWTHRCCERCWFDEPDAKPRGVTDDDVYRRPTQAKEDIDPGVCCVCGGMTITKILIRENESALLCLGRHDDWSWSRVQVSLTR